MIDWGSTLIGFAPFLAAGGVGVYLVLRVVRAVERRGTSAAALAELHERVGRLEETMAGVATEMERMAEAAQFTTRLLQERRGVTEEQR